MKTCVWMVQAVLVKNHYAVDNRTWISLWKVSQPSIYFSR